MRGCQVLGRSIFRANAICPCPHFDRDARALTKSGKSCLLEIDQAEGLRTRGIWAIVAHVQSSIRRKIGYSRCRFGIGILTELFLENGNMVLVIETNGDVGKQVS